MNRNLKSNIKEFGDYQTPDELASEIITLIQKENFQPATIIEPTCGLGAFILASGELFPNSQIVGIDINKTYVEYINDQLRRKKSPNNIEIQTRDFFTINWKSLISNYSEPYLIVGNPPWITTADLSVINSRNIPKKFNIHNYPGLEAKMGRSNFDISEWMMLELLNSVKDTSTTFVQICKLSVARKVFKYCVDHQINIEKAYIFLIDAFFHFKASVEACVLFLQLTPGKFTSICEIFEKLNKNKLLHEIGVIDGKLIANIEYYRKWNHLNGESPFEWRSGIKHDSVKVMEFIKGEKHYINGLKEEIEIENDYLYPMLKSSDLANNTTNPNRWMLLTQKHTGQDTSILRKTAPKTWKYLMEKASYLDRRKSAIYLKRPRFSIFGIGDYTLEPWKIAISGFYKNLKFLFIGPKEGKPVVLDDTCYFLSFDNYWKAMLVHTLLNHPITDEYYRSYIFWDMKRPISKQILMNLDLKKLLEEIGYQHLIEALMKKNPYLKQEKIPIILKNLF
ncbi:hypothetical protein [Candidatus Hodarchaeum mangrovi]